MKGKLLIAAIVLSIVFLSGCVTSDIPTDKPIVLSKDSPTFDVVIRSDNREVTWTLDETASRTDDLSGDKNEAHYLLEYRNIPVGNHTLKVSDSEDSLTWQVQVVGPDAAQNGNKDTTDYHYPSWEERVKEAHKTKK